MEMEINMNGNLPKELVSEILVRLPVKALFQCKCVCKDWCAFIESPSFIKQHFSHEKNQGRLLFRIHLFDAYATVYENKCAHVMYKDDESHPSLEVFDQLPLMLTDGRAERLMGPDNGVFCVVSGRGRIGLLNPAVGEFKLLPPLPSYQTDFLAGFGFDSFSGDFKVLAFLRSRSSSFAFIYNLSSDSWRSSEAVDSLDMLTFFDSDHNHLILNGVNYWILKFANRNFSSILAFDLSSEMFQEMSIPDSLRNTEAQLGITKYGDTLAVMSFEPEGCFDLWEMARDGLWSKKCSIGPFEGNIRMLCVWKKNMLFFQSSSSPVNTCDISTQNLTTLVQETDPLCKCDVVKGHIYKESLVSINGVRVDSVQDFFTRRY